MAEAIRSSQPDRYGCAAHRNKNTCSNSNTIKRQHLESRVLSGLKDSMLAPDLVADFIRAFAAESASIRAEAISSQYPSAGGRLVRVKGWLRVCARKEVLMSTLISTAWPR